VPEGLDTRASRARPSVVFKLQAVRAPQRTHEVKQHTRCDLVLKSETTSVHVRDDIASRPMRRIATVTLALEGHVEHQRAVRHSLPWPSPHTSAHYGKFFCI